jgi:hypothetical protein
MEGTLGKVSYSFTLSALAVLGLVLVITAALGTHAVVASHPKARSGNLSHTAHHWAAPAVLTAAAVVHLSRLQSPVALIGALLAFGATAGLALWLEYGTVDGAEAGYGRARWMLNIVVYIVALAVFSAAITADLPPQHAAILCGLAAALLAIDILRQPGRTPDIAALYVGFVAALAGFAAHRLLLQEIAAIRISVLLLLLLYALTGVMQQQLRGRASWRVRAEYLALLAVGAWALLRFGLS